MRKTKRQEIILGRLLLGEVLNTTKLAKQLEVSERTILNDIKELQLAHKIISPKKGFYKLKDIPSFMKQEIQDIVKNLIYSLAFCSFGEFEKEIQDLYNKDNKEFLIDFDIEFEKIKDINIFKYLLHSIKWNYSIEIEYEDTKKIVHPFKIANYFCYWYLIGYDLKEDEIKAFFINKIGNVHMLYENLYENALSIKKLDKDRLIKTNLKSIKLKIYPPYLDLVTKRRHINCEIIEQNDKYILLRFYYYTKEQALEFIKRYLPSVKILDEELKEDVKNLLQNFLI